MADESSRPANEQTPLLQPPVPENGHPAPQPDAAGEGEDEEETVLVDETANKRIVLTLGTIYVGVFLGALDATVIATLSAPIATSFHSLSLLSWLASGYLIANAACQPLSGRLTDIFGRRNGLIFSNIFFAAGNLICGLAQSDVVMIAGRVIAGVGGGGLMAISTFVASDLVPLRQRGVVQGIGNLCFGTGAGLGGLIGGWVHDTWNWRVIFLAQVPLVVISGTLVATLMTDIPAKQSKKSKLARIDWMGSFTLLVSLVLLLVGLNSGGNSVPWGHPMVISSIALSGVGFVFFVYWEASVAAEPVLPVRLLLNRTVASACLTNWFSTMGWFTMLFYLPIFLQVSGLSATEAGVRFIPGSIGASLGSLLSGLAMNYTGKYKILAHVLLLSFVFGVAASCTLRLDGPSWPSFVYFPFIGAGYGGSLTVTLLATISAVEHKHQAVVTSATYAFRSTGSTIGVTIASAVYQNVLRSQLTDHFGDSEAAREVIARIRDNLDELKRLPAGWTAGVLESYQNALTATFATGLGMAVIAYVCSTFMRQNVLHTTLARDGDDGEDRQHAGEA